MADLTYERERESGSAERERLFSPFHPHPVVFTTNYSGPVRCKACFETLYESDLPYYTCKECLSDCFHKRCAEPPRNIYHSSHSQHLLTLHPQQSPECKCDLCGKEVFKAGYHCPLCEFIIDIKCAFQDWTIRHASHDHDLNLLEKRSLFDCDACGENREDKSYVCTKSKCQFWIHYCCALSPVTLQYRDHPHPLTLHYELPPSQSAFSPVCNICNGELKAPYWFYSCGQCRYFVHLKCATSQPKPSVATKQELDANLNLMSFPIDNHLDVISHFVKEISLGDNKTITTTTTKTLKHFGHSHLLQLCEELNKEAESDNIMLCKACVQPISAPYYNCAECSFSLHKCCAEIPRTVKLKVKCDYQHTLFLFNQLDVSGFSCCNACRKPFNGLSLNCSGPSGRCNVSLDVHCAALLNRNLKHEAHKAHSLFPTSYVSYHFEFSKCNACGEKITDDHFALECKEGDFKIHTKCAMLPRTIRHRWDKHPLLLSFPPFINYPDDFYCDYCEEEIDPKYWLYLCIECDQSFHIACLPQAKEFSSMKHEGTFKVLQHSHALTYVERSETDNQCNICSKGSITKNFLECQPCNFHICYECVKVKASNSGNRIVDPIRTRKKKKKC